MASVDPGTNTLMRSPAAERNKQALLNVLKDLIPNGEVQALEIGSGEYINVGSIHGLI